MRDVLTVMKKQLDIEMKSAQQKLTSSNLDTIYKLTTSIMNLQRMNVITEQPKETPKYSDGTFDKNIDILYERYMSAKKIYREKGGQVYKDALIDSVKRLMAELYDMLGQMLRDCECMEEKKEIQSNIKRLTEI